MIWPYAAEAIIRKEKKKTVRNSRRRAHCKSVHRFTGPGNPFGAMTTSECGPTWGLDMTLGCTASSRTISGTQGGYSLFGELALDSVRFWEDLG